MTAPVRHLPEINEGLPNHGAAMMMVGRPAAPGDLSGNDAINDAGQTAVLVGRHTFVSRILLETLHSGNLDTWVVSIATRWERRRKWQLENACA